MAAAIATLASAVCYGLAFPPFAWWPLAWVAFVPFLTVVRQASWRRTVLLGWLWTVVASAMTTGWFPRAVAGYYQQTWLVGIALFFAVTTCTAAVQYTAFALCWRRLARRPGAALPLLAGAAWAAAELARVDLPGRDPWAISPYSQAGVASLVQVADLTGVYGVAFLLMAVNAALAELWRARGAAWRAVAATAAVVALVLGYGALRLASAGPDVGRTTAVAVVQGNLDQGSQWRPEFYGENLERYLRLSRDVVTARRPALVLWPESAMTFFLDREPLYVQAIARIVAGGGAELLAGGPRAVGDVGARYYNSAFLLARDGRIAAIYDKQQLLPFAEYFPLPALDFLRRHFGRVREFTPGTTPAPLPTIAGRAGIVICNEAMFPDIAAARVRGGAEYLVNLANDSWVGDHQFSAMTLDMVAMRAVEQRRFVVRASTSGPSAVIDPFGRVIARSAMDTAAILTGEIEPRSELTLYARVGDAFALACAAATGLALVAGARRA